MICINMVSMGNMQLIPTSYRSIFSLLKSGMKHPIFKCHLTAQVDVQTCCINDRLHIHCVQLLLINTSKMLHFTLSPLENSTISSAWMFLRPYTRAIPSPIDSTRPVSSRLACGAWPRIRSSKMEETSAPPIRRSDNSFLVLSLVFFLPQLYIFS